MKAPSSLQLLVLLCLRLANSQRSSGAPGAWWCSQCTHTATALWLGTLGELRRSVSERGRTAEETPLSSL